MARNNMRVAAVLAGAIMAAAGCAFDGATDPPVYIDQTTQGDNGTPNVPQPYGDGELLTDPGLKDLEGALCLVGPFDLEPIVVPGGTPGQEMPMVTIGDAARGTLDMGNLDCRLVQNGTNPMGPSKVVCTSMEVPTLAEAAEMEAPIAGGGSTVCDQNPDGCDAFDPVPISANVETPGYEMPTVTLQDAARGTFDSGVLQCEFVGNLHDPMMPAKVVCTTPEPMTLAEAAQMSAPLAGADATVCEQNPDGCTAFEPVPVDPNGTTPGYEMPAVTLEDAARSTFDMGALQCEVVQDATNPMGPSKVVCTTMEPMTLEEAAEMVAPLTFTDTTVCESEGEVPTGCEPVETPVIEVYMPCDVPRG